MNQPCNYRHFRQDYYVFHKEKVGGLSDYPHAPKVDLHAIYPRPRLLRGGRARWAAAVLAALPAAASAADVSPTTTPTNDPVAGLVSELGADDAAARKTAAAKLVALGAAARPAVLQAAHSDDPETRAQAASVLLKLPWAMPDDPAPVREILAHYPAYAPPDAPDAPPAGVAPEAAAPPAPSIEARKAAVDALAKLPNFQGWDALIRLAYEDPSDEVRWAVVHELRTADDGPRLAKLRKTDAPRNDPPLAALYGAAWLAADPVKAQPLLEQAVEGEFRNPSADGGEVDFIVSSLARLYVVDQRYDAAADLDRRAWARDAAAGGTDAPPPLLDLLALHAEHGPLAGLEDDRKRAGGLMEKSEPLYALARVYEKKGQTGLAQFTRQTAFDAGNSSPARRYEVGKFLVDQGWDAEAEAELKALLSAPPSDDVIKTLQINAHFLLASVAARREDDFVAAEEKKAAMSMHGGNGGGELIRMDGGGHTWSAAEDDIWAEIHWRYLKAADAQGDQAGVTEHLNELVKLMPTDADIATEVVPLLKRLHKAPEAERLFAAAYAKFKAKLDADPSNPTLMNGVAWLDARCDEKLEEALKLSTASVAAMPNNAAVLDTLAEVNFHLGRFSEAVDLETKALALRPDDKFMNKQLARFKAKN